MTDGFINVSGKVLDLANEAPVLAALGDFAANLATLRASGLAVASAKQSLIAVLRTADDQATELIFSNAGLAGVLVELKKLSAFVEQFEQAGGGFFLEPLSAFATGAVAQDQYRWDVINAATTADFKGIGLDLAGNLALTFAADVATELWPYSDAPGEYLLSVEAEAKASASAGVAVPFHALKVTGEGGVSGQIAAQWVFDPPDAQRGQLIAALLAARLPKLANPFSLASVQAAIDTSDLVGLRLEPRGTATISVGLAIGFDEDIAAGVTISGGADVTASVKIATGYELSVRAVRPRTAGESHALAIKASRTRLTEREVQLGIGVDIDVSALTARIRSLIGTKAGLLRTELASISAFLDPGTLARRLLAPKIAAAAGGLAGNAAFKSAIETDVNALFGIGQAGGLSGFLEGQLADLMSRGGTLGTDAAGDVATRIVKALPGPLQGLAGKTQVESLLSTQLASLITALRGKLQEQVTGLSNTAAATLDAVIKDAGAAVTAGGDALDKRLAGVRTLFGWIDSIAERVAAEAENPLRTMIKLKIAATESSWDGRGLEIAGVISDVSDETSDLYRAIQSGDWQKLATLFGGATVPGFALDKAASRLALSMGSGSGQSVHAVVLGFGLNFNASDLSQAEISIDGFGNILILAKGELKKHRDIFGKERSVSFTNAFAVAAASQGSAAFQATSIGYAAQAQQNKLKKSDARAFLKSVAPLATGDFASRANSALDQWFGNGEGSAVNGSIGFRAGLGPRQIELLRALGVAQSSNPDIRRKVVERALSLSRAVDRSHIDDALAVARAVIGSKLVKSLGSDTAIWLEFMRKTGVDSTVGLERWAGNDGPMGGSGFFSHAHANAIELTDFLSGGGTLIRAKKFSEFADVIAQIVALAAAATPATLQQTLKAVWAEQAKLTNLHNEWLRLDDNVLDWFKTGVSRRTVTFMLILCDLLSDPITGIAAPVACHVSLAKADSQDAATAIALVLQG